MNRLITTSAIALGTVLLAAGTAAAQAYPAPPPAPARSGFVVGFGAGLGNIACSSIEDVCDGTEEAGGLSFHVGGMVSPRLAILLDVWAMLHAEDDVRVTHTITTVGVKAWLTRRLWLTGGLGGARASLTADIVGVQVGGETETVFGVMGAVGYDLVANRSFALSLELKGGTGFYDEEGDVRGHSTAVGVGLTWF